MKQQQKTLENKQVELSKLQKNKNHTPLDFAQQEKHPLLSAQDVIGNHGVLQLFGRGIIQPKLKVGKPNDKYEQEADRVAESIVSMPMVQRKDCPLCEDEEEENEVVQTKPISNQITPLIQRQGVDTEEETDVTEEDEEIMTKRMSGDQSIISSTFSEEINNSRGKGTELPLDTLNFMQNKFGTNFNDVRIHTDKQSLELNRHLNSQAFTLGKDIFFSSGYYKPDETVGRKLLAHELTHVVQQKKSNIYKSKHIVLRKEAQQEKGWFERAGGWYSKKKWVIYRAMITGMKKGNKKLIDLYRALINKFPQWASGPATFILDQFEEISEILTNLCLAIIGLAVGFVEGIVSLVVGIIKLAIGLGKLIGHALYSIKDKGEAFKKDLEFLGAVMKNLVPGIKQLVSSWLERYMKAPLEEQVLMGGELVGQIEAFLATFLVAGAKAGQATVVIHTIKVESKLLITGITETGAATGVKVPALTVATTTVPAKSLTQAGVVMAEATALATGGPGKSASGTSLKPEAKTTEDIFKEINKEIDLPKPKKLRGAKKSEPTIERIAGPKRKKGPLIGKGKEAHVTQGTGGVIKRVQMSIRYPGKSKLARLRKTEFPPKRSAWLKKMADNPRCKDFFGPDSESIMNMRNGELPAGYQVHHNHPLAAGGANSESNFSLIPHEVHTRVTSEFEASRLASAKDFEFPIFDDFVPGILTRTEKITF